MTLARFFSRIDDAISPFTVGEVDLRAFLSGKRVRISAEDIVEKSPLHVAGIVLAANLLARLYPIIELNLSPRVAQEARRVITAVNPLCEVIDRPTIGVEKSFGEIDGEIAWGCAPTTGAGLRVAPQEWSVIVHSQEAERIYPANALTALACAAIGASELFRHVFRDLLPAQPRTVGPASFNLLTYGAAREPLPSLGSEIDIGTVHLVGAGAVGQAMIYALARVGVRGELVVLDHEDVSLSNLQRYVLTEDTDVGSSKTSLARRALEQTGMRVREIGERVTAEHIGEADCVCVAVDSDTTRIAIQAALPREIFNAWTQPEDIGWSRHEQFGVAPCLACLYWPTGAKPHLFQRIASGMGIAPMRALSYLTNRVPVNAPLPEQAIVRIPVSPTPEEVAEWSSRALLDDLATARGQAREELDIWNGNVIADVYRDGVCAGALVRTEKSSVTEEMAVPLAHQSVLAGIMLAAQLVISRDQTVKPARAVVPEARLDLLKPFPQIPGRPRSRLSNCLCSDADFLASYARKWQEHRNEAREAVMT